MHGCWDGMEQSEEVVKCVGQVRSGHTGGWDWISSQDDLQVIYTGEGSGMMVIDICVRDTLNECLLLGEVPWWFFAVCQSSGLFSNELIRWRDCKD